MTERYISPQSGPVDVKTNKVSHYHSQEHTEPAGRQNEAPLCDLEDLKTNFVDMYVHRQLPNYAPIMRLVAEAERKFDQRLRKVKASAWDEGYVSGFEEDKRFGATSNPYESEEA
jgi:hypothetical protein